MLFVRHFSPSILGAGIDRIGAIGPFAGKVVVTAAMDEDGGDGIGQVNRGRCLGEHMALLEAIESFNGFKSRYLTDCPAINGWN